MNEHKWTTEEEQFLANLEKQCNDLYDHNIQDYQYYHGMSGKFNIPILIISALNALCAISLNDFLAQRYVSIINAVLSAGTGVLGSIQLYMKLNERMTNALRATIIFKKLALKISKELTIARADRTTEGQQFLSDCFAEFNTAVEQCNPIEKQVHNHLAFTREHEIKTPSTPLRRVADRFIKMARMTPRSGNSLDESRGRSLVNLVSMNAGSGGSPVSEV